MVASTGWTRPPLSGECAVVWLRSGEGGFLVSSPWRGPAVAEIFLAGPRGGVREAWPSGRAASPLDLLPVLFAEPQPFVHAAELALRLVPYAEPQPFVRLADRWLRFALCRIADR